jgi:hypothetical protein
MLMIAIQYLEPGPGITKITPAAARRKLRLAFERLPLTTVLLGWRLPPELVEACAEETQRHRAHLYLWQPVFAGDGVLVPEPDWQVTGLNDNSLAGFRGMPEFTFICPNKPAARQAVLSHIEAVLHTGAYQGIFLDRIRFPSPAADPTQLLACFCPDCRSAAAQQGLDLDEVKRSMRALVVQPGGGARLLRHILAETGGALDAAFNDLAIVDRFMQFRKQSVTRLVEAAARLARGHGLLVGLDCFSPCLAGLVGQDLAELSACCDWIKVMSYGHTFAPAGLPFELLGLSTWLEKQDGLDERTALQVVAETTNLPLPVSRESLLQNGLSPHALGVEIRRARTLGVNRLLAGIELVDLPGVTRLNTAQVQADLAEFQAAGVDGLVLSWDLWHIPQKRLDLIPEYFAQ